MQSQCSLDLSKQFLHTQKRSIETRSRIRDGWHSRRTRWAMEEEARLGLCSRGVALHLRYMHRVQFFERRVCFLTLLC